MTIALVEAKAGCRPVARLGDGEDGDKVLPPNEDRGQTAERQNPQLEATHLAWLADQVFEGCGSRSAS